MILEQLISHNLSKRSAMGNTNLKDTTKLFLQLDVTFKTIYGLGEKKNVDCDFKCTLPPDFVVPCGLSTLYRCSLTTLPKTKPCHEIPLIRDCFNTRGAACIQTIFTIAAGSSSLSFVQVCTRQLTVSSLSKGILSTLNFHKSNGTDGTWTRNLLHPKRAP